MNQKLAPDLRLFWPDYENSPDSEQGASISPITFPSNIFSTVDGVDTRPQNVTQVSPKLHSLISQELNLNKFISDTNML